MTKNSWLSWQEAVKILLEILGRQRVHQMTEGSKVGGGGDADGGEGQEEGEEEERRRRRRRRKRERVCCLLVLNSVTSTPQWIRQL